MSNIVYLLLGSNRSDRMAMLKRAYELIEKHAGKVLVSSSVYETAPWGFTDNVFFLNQVLCITTLLSPSDLLDKLLTIEANIGRTRTTKNYSSRIIDIDILFYNDQIIDHTLLTIPHPRLHQRKFTLIPLAEISETFIHPSLKKTVGELLADCSDEIDVQLYKP